MMSWSSPTLAEARGRIRELAHLNAFISVTEEEGDGPVIAVKDIVDVKGTVTTGGGVILPDVPATQDAPCMRSTRSYGCVVVGKTNLHEWAYGATSDNPHYGTVRNPHDSSRVAGGSSGGSAVAVATGMCEWAVGSDTGGSIRIPAALCGVVGFKPTYGSVSVEGVIPLSRSLDTIGPLAGTVRASARALSMLTGRNDLSPSSPAEPDSLALAQPAGWIEGLDDTVAAAWSSIGRWVPAIELPPLPRLQAVGSVILQFEAAAYHRDWTARYADRYDPWVLARIQTAAGVTEQQYREALVERDELRTEMARAMAGVDAVLLPSTPIVAPPVGDPDVTVTLTRFTRPFNTTGHPVISLPIRSPGLPVGVQVVGQMGQDRRLAAIAWALEQDGLPQLRSTSGTS